MQQGKDSQILFIKKSKIMRGNNMKDDRIVYRHADGVWVNKKVDADKASSLHDKQKGAEDAARDMLHSSAANPAGVDIGSAGK